MDEPRSKATSNLNRFKFVSGLEASGLAPENAVDPTTQWICPEGTPSRAVRS
jgi:hypothetical protein